MGIRKLGYIGLNVTDPGAWADLLGRTLGVGITTDKAGTDEVALAELDAFKYRLALHPAVVDGPREVGWIVDSPRELDRVTRRLTDAGFAVQEGSADETRLRGATQLRWFTDPVGYRVEMAVGETKVRTSPARPADMHPGVTGLGHFVLAGPKLDELRELYESVLEFKLTDYRAPACTSSAATRPTTASRSRTRKPRPSTTSRSSTARSTTSDAPTTGPRPMACPSRSAWAGT